MGQTKMEQIAEALRTLLPGTSWKMTFTPSNQQEFEEAFEVVTGFDQDRNAVYSSSPADFGVTWDQIEAAIAAQGAA